MNIIIPYTKFETDYIFFIEKKSFRKPINSDIIENDKWYNTNKMTTGNYTKIMYSTKYFSMNGVYLSFPIIISTINKTHINISLSDLSDDFLYAMKNIESECLAFYADFYEINKRPVYHLWNQLMSGSIKYYRENHGSQLYLKISGIWDTEIEYGITYKIIMA